MGHDAVAFMKDLPGTWDGTALETPRGKLPYDITFDAKGPELVPMVLGFGETVEVLEPDWLRQRVIEELRGALALYA